MRKIVILALLIVNLCEAGAQLKPVKRIGLINPTARNIEKLLFLAHQGFIKTDSIQIVGILHESQTELRKTSSQYVRDQGCGFIFFESVKGQVPLDSLFLPNRWSSQFSKIFNKTDALIFLGGDDIPPRLYGENTFLTTEQIPAEQNWEISFLYHLTGGYQHDAYVPLLEQRPGYLILGICLGMQEMNVAGGGSLYQDIPYQIYGLSSFEEVINLPADNQHKNYRNRIDNNQSDVTAINFHHLAITPNSYLDLISDNRSPMVASVHHQAVKKIGKNYTVIATSTDKKVIEAITNNRFKNVYGIQFHTDIIALYDDKARFKTSPGQVTQLSKEDCGFHINFWKDFSERLNSRK